MPYVVKVDTYTKKTPGYEALGGFHEQMAMERPIFRADELTDEVRANFYKYIAISEISKKKTNRCIRQIKRSLDRYRAC